MSKQINKQAFGQSGLTLVELLVASFLGLLLVGVVGAMYLTSVGSFRTSSELSRVQENTRFASHFIKQSLRESGYSKCGVETLDHNFLTQPFDSTVGGGLLGWEYAGTDIDDNYTLAYVDLNEDSSLADIALAKQSNSEANATNWATISGAPALTDIVAEFRPMSGSDIIAITRETELTDVVVTGVLTHRLEYNNTAFVNADKPPLGSVLKVGNCNERNVFARTNNQNFQRIRGNDTGGTNIAQASRPSSTWWSKVWGPTDSLFMDITSFYYVGTGASGLPALYVAESQCGFRILAAVCSEPPEPVELVEGVENMQLLYGVDSDADGVANRFFSADNVGDFSNVVSLRISLLMRSNQRSEQLEDISSYMLSDRITINPIDKGILRYVATSTVELRNRGN